ncbi:MAG: hypothetical protein DI628_01990 [Blastochloris viridis]|uniref:Uncharacterized protein n=1 Tax=Blastochloris viridis TaxID=1079 RepID=A0A6N4R2Z5_BLAVI|nr:MAG: hypothetical protein DI628_01990 [Blastochloris viridis]
MHSHSPSFDPADFEDPLPGELKVPHLSLGDYVTLNALGFAHLSEEEEIEGQEQLNTLLRWDGSPAQVIDFDVSSSGDPYTVIRLLDRAIPVPQIFLTHAWLH